MKCHEWIGSISWNFISLCLHLCSSAVCCRGAVLYCRMNWKPPGVFVLWEQVQPLQRSDREGFNGVLPTRACSCAPDKVLSVQLTRPALVPRHIAQVIAFIIVQPRGFSGSDTGARRSRGGRTAAPQSGPRDNPEFGNFQSRFWVTWQLPVKSSTKK